MIYILNTMTYSAEFIGLITKRDEYDRQIGEMYYRCKIKNGDKNANAIIKIPNVMIGNVEIVQDYDDHYDSLIYRTVTNESYLKLKIEPKNNTIFEIIMEDKNMTLGNLVLDEIKDIKFINQLPNFDKNEIKDVRYNDPATIVFWKDGTKTVVKCQKDKGDTYNPELGLAMCIIKKMCDNKGNYNDVFNKWLPKESE